MADPRPAFRIDNDAARKALSEAGMRYLLAFSLTLAVIAMSGAWIVPALLR